MSRETTVTTRMARVIYAIFFCFVLSGCTAALYALEATASTAEIANNILGVDVSLKQDTPGKSPILNWLSKVKGEILNHDSPQRPINPPPVSGQQTTH